MENYTKERERDHTQMKEIRTKGLKDKNCRIKTCSVFEKKKVLF